MAPAVLSADHWSFPERPPAGPARVRTMSDRSDRLLTYEELAAALGRSAEAVRQLAKRKRWRRVISNDDGKARVVVPVEVLEAPHPPDDPRTPPADRSDTGAEPTGDACALLDMLRAHVAELRHEAREARSTVADLTRRLGAAEGEVSAMRAILGSRHRPGAGFTLSRTGCEH